MPASESGRLDIKKKHKFGIELPKTAEQDHALDVKNGNTSWPDAIYNEIENVRVAFKVLPDREASTHRPPICVMPYAIQHQNGGFQMKDQPCGRRPHDQGTDYYYICQHSVERDS